MQPSNFMSQHFRNLPEDKDEREMERKKEKTMFSILYVALNVALLYGDN